MKATKQVSISSIARQKLLTVPKNLRDIQKDKLRKNELYNLVTKKKNYNSIRARRRE